MKKIIKFTAFIIAFVFLAEQLVYPAPYSGQWKRNASALRPVSSRAALPAESASAFFTNSHSGKPVLVSVDKIEEIIAALKLAEGREKEEQLIAELRRVQKNKNGVPVGHGRRRCHV